MQENIQEFIYQQIPIVEANKFSIHENEHQTFSVQGSFTDHTNHTNSVFGASLSTALTLSAWLQARKVAQESGIEKPVIVIQSQIVNFLKPVTKDFSASAIAWKPEEMERFRAILPKFPKCRLTIEAHLSQSGDPEVLVRFSGDFVILNPWQQGTQGLINHA